MPKNTIPPKSRQVKQRATLGMEILDRREAQEEMFQDGADLPLFSGTPMTIRIQGTSHTEQNTQAKMADCPICFDTGTAKINGKTRRCWCQIAEQQDVRTQLLSQDSKALQRVKRNAPSAYERDNDVEKALKEAAAIQPLSERFQTAGTAGLSTTDLITLVLGEQTPVIASRLIAQFKSLARMRHTTLSEITSVKGMTTRRAAVIQSALELGARQMSERPEDERVRIASPSDAQKLFAAEMTGLDHEEMRVLTLNTKNQVLGMHTVYKGSVHTTVIRVGELFKDALRANAPAIIIAHNHPSGDPTPSPEDVAVTREIVSAAKTLDIDLLDHLIIGDGRYTSLKEKGLGFS